MPNGGRKDSTSPIKKYLSVRWLYRYTPERVVWGGFTQSK
jgi:hypothetical protein